MEWTFDPLQALNAHLNFAKLGVVCQEYARNVYGESTSALHKGTPTDRFVVEWHLASAHVDRRVRRSRERLGFTAERGDPAGFAADVSGGTREPAATDIAVRAAEASDAPLANRVVDTGAWQRSTPGDLAIETPRLWIEIPAAFTEMQQQAPDLALEWRHHSREMFETYFARGYRAVDFEIGRRRYLLALPQ
jgi:predicted GNAT superfamily acetyltransferase